MAANKRIRGRQFFTLLADNRFDIAGTEMSISEVIEFLSKSEEFWDLLDKNEKSIALLVKFKLFQKALGGDFNCMRFIFDKMIKPDNIEQEETFFAEIPVIRNGKVTEEYEELAI